MFADILDKLNTRVKELESFIGQSTANHHAIIGRLEEAKSIIGIIESVVNAVETPAAPEAPAPEAPNA